MDKILLLMEAIVLRMCDNYDHWYYDEASAKIVKKPWGKEVWLNYRKGEKVGEFKKRYVMKKLYISSGTKTSFQYHKNL